MKMSITLLHFADKIKGFERLQAFLGNLSHTLALERLGPSLTRRIFWRAHTNRRIVALSFDDGPNSAFTPQLIDILQQYAVPATFFLIGQYVEKHPGIAREIASGPHEIGNHTYSHKMLPFLNDREVIREVETTHSVIADITGKRPVFLRPPMGLFTKRTVTLVERLGYKTVVGDVYPRDPNRPGTQRIIRRVLRRVMPGSLIILHDGGNTAGFDRSQTLAGVRVIIPRLLERGFEFVTLSKLIAANKNGAG